MDLDGFKHIAIVYNGDKICGIGYNMINMKDESEHAEYRALKDLQRRISNGEVKPRKFKMLVIRIRLSHETGNFYTMMSRPCPQCQKLLAEQNLVKKVYWSVDDKSVEHCSTNCFDP